MRLEFDEDDLKPQAREISTRYIQFEHLNEKAQAAVMIVGRGTFFRMKDTRHQTHQAIHPPGTDKVETEYRELTIARVHRLGNGMNLQLSGCATIFVCNNDFLRRNGINPDELTEGRKVRIRGRNGNEDVMPAKFDTLQEIHLIPIEATV